MKRVFLCLLLTLSLLQASSSEHRVAPGETADAIAKKMLTPKQRAQWLKSLSTQKTPILHAGDHVHFDIQKDQIQLKIQSPKNRSLQQRVLTLDAGDSVISRAQKEQLPASVIRALHQKAKDLKSVRPKDQIQITWNAQGELKELKHLSLKESKTHASQHVFRLSAGENVMARARAEKLPPVVIQQLLARNTELKKVRPEDEIHLKWDPKGRIESLKILAKGKPRSKEALVRQARSEENAKMLTLRLDHAFEVQAKKAGLPQTVINNLHDIYRDRPEVSKLLKAGSTLELIYTQHSSHPIAYARLSKGGRRYEAIRHQQGKQISYYEPSGKAYHQGFLREPLAHSRVSSPFSLMRKHPKLRIRRPHYGVDFAAKTGTPVWASGPGKVTYAGIRGGYGRVVIIEHSPSVTTLYAHLSQFAPKIKAGATVKRKQTIGLVGCSGLCTASHLHYEFHINQQPKDPLTVALPKAQTLRGPELRMMLAERQRWLALTRQQMPS